MKPKINKFRKAVEQYGGNLTKVAKSLKVSRSQVYNWINEDPEFKTIVDDTRLELFDVCITSARVLAAGIPDIQGGKMVGWIERPDSGMVRYILGTLGRKEGFGENIDITTNGKDIPGNPNLFRVLTPEDIRNFDKHFDEEY